MQDWDEESYGSMLVLQHAFPMITSSLSEAYAINNPTLYAINLFHEWDSPIMFESNNSKPVFKPSILLPVKYKIFKEDAKLLKPFINDVASNNAICLL